MAAAPNLSGLKRLLVATDFSPRADIALTRAIQLASEHGAALTMLHVCDTRASNEILGGQPAAEKRLRDRISNLALPDPSTVTARIATGKPVLEIVRNAREQGAGLIVVGAHNTQVFKDLLFESIAGKVARQGGCPVLMVQRATHGPYRRVLASVDFSDNCRYALEFALGLTPEAEFYVVHVYKRLLEQLRRAGLTTPAIVRYGQTLAKEAERELNAFLGSIHHPRKAIINGESWYGRPHHEITTVAKRLGADLVVLGARRRAWLPYNLFGSVAEHVLREASFDVLVARANAAHFRFS